MGDYHHGGVALSGFCITIAALGYTRQLSPGSSKSIVARLHGDINMYSCLLPIYIFPGQLTCKALQ